MCSGRVDPEFVLRAFANGMDGVFIGGCRLNECNYITHGNYHALNMALLFRKIMGHVGLNPERLGIKFMSSGEGVLFTGFVGEFVNKIRFLGPIGSGEGIDADALKFRFEAVEKLIPYLKLVQSEKLSMRLESEQEHIESFTDGEVSRLLHQLITDKLTVCQIMLLLRESPRSIGEISGLLGLSASEVSKHLVNSSRQGLVKYDESRNRYATA